MHLTRKTLRKTKRTVRIIILVLFFFIAVVAGLEFFYYRIVSSRPLFVSPLPFLNGEVFSPEDGNKQMLQNLLKQNKIEFTNIQVASDASYLVQIDGNGVVIFSPTRDIKKQISSLQFILSRLTMEGKLFSKLDLRFDKPTIVLK